MHDEPVVDWARGVHDDSHWPASRLAPYQMPATSSPSPLAGIGVGCEKPFWPRPSLRFVLRDAHAGTSLRCRSCESVACLVGENRTLRAVSSLGTQLPPLGFRLLGHEKKKIEAPLLAAGNLPPRARERQARSRAYLYK